MNGLMQLQIALADEVSPVGPPELTTNLAMDYIIRLPNISIEDGTSNTRVPSTLGIPAEMFDDPRKNLFSLLDQLLEVGPRIVGLISKVAMPSEELSRIVFSVLLFLGPSTRFRCGHYLSYSSRPKDAEEMSLGKLNRSFLI
jgi:hypothetical protein